MLARLKAMQIAGRLDAAEAAFARMRATAPQTMHAWLGLGYCASLKGDAEAARQAFAQAAAVCPGDEEAAIACSEALSHQRDFDAARGILEGRPETVAQQMALAALEELAGESDRAAACYQRASALDRRDDRPLRRLLDLHRGWGEFAAAGAVACRLAALGPQHEAAAWHYRGQIHRSAQNGEAAISAFQRALALTPNADDVAIDLSKALQTAGRKEEAFAVFVERAPRHRLLLALSDLELSRRDHDAALRHLVAAHALDPLRPDGLARSAKVEADRGELDAALTFADRINALGTEHRLVALRSRFDTFKALGEAVRALGVAEQMAALVPADAEVLVELARQHRLTGDPRAARQVVQRALACNARSATALVEAAEQASALEDQETALQLLHRVLHLAPGRSGYHIRYGRILHDMDRVKEARHVLVAAEARFGLSAEIRGERIRRLREAGHVYAALDEARRAQAIFPQHFGRWSDQFYLELRLSSLAEAEACCRRAPVKNRGDETHLHLARARLARRARDFDAATAHLKAALRQQTHQRAIWVTLFELHLRQFNVSEAADCFARASALEAPSRRMRGATTNASQSANGQMLNEFLIDRRAVAELAAARLLDPVAELRTLLALVQARPDHVPTAFGLLNALRRSGVFDQDKAAASRTESTGKIPHNIGQFWDNPKLSDELLDLSASWRTHNNSHRYYLFNADTARNYLRRHYPPEVGIAYRRCGDPVIQSDLFRLAFLLREGGVWADMDDRCLRPLSTFVPGDARACFWQEAPGSIGNNFIAVVPGHPILQRALVIAVNSINRGDRDKVWVLTGPGLLSRAFALELAEAGDQWQARLDPITVLDEYDIYPNIAIHCRTAHKRLGKHWSKTAFAGASGHSGSELERRRFIGTMAET